MSEFIVQEEVQVDTARLPGIKIMPENFPRNPAHSWSFK